VVPYSVLAVVALAAFALGILISRRRSDPKVIWESPRTGPDHEAAIADPELLSLLEQKQLIPAIKRYRELTGAGLKDSKVAVESLQRSLGSAANQ
jgi:ribosomal protein L7/L12